MTKQPNIVLIVTDQHRADWLGCTGHPVVKTPNIDELASRGTVFNDFHVALPVCMPNRASLMTGRMPSVHGARYNGCPLPLTANTFVDVLATAGYDTALIGKSHLQPFTDVAPLRKSDDTTRLIDEAWKPDGADYELEAPQTHAGASPADLGPSFYGFNHVDLVTGHGDKCGGHYGHWFRNEVKDWQALQDPSNELPHNYTCPQAYRTPIPEEAYPTAWIGDRAVEYCKDINRKANPFFAMVSFPDPHHPFNPPGKYWDMYAPDEFSVELPYEAHKNPTPPLRDLRAMWEAGEEHPIPQMAFHAEDQHIREAMALTAGMITMIDDQVGRIIAALKESGQFENTIVIFTSDHGDYLGDFGMLLKGGMPFNSITRVPFIWADPERPATGQSTALASTIDISASILDRVGLAPYNGIQGKSFLPSLDGQKQHRDALLIEHNDGGIRAGYTRPARVRTLRTKDWRLTLNAGESWGELYNLQKDPNETDNLWSDPQVSDIQMELMTALAERLTFQMDESPLSQRLA